MDEFAFSLPPEALEELVRRVAERVLAELKAEGSHVPKVAPFLTVSEAAAYIGAKPQRIYDLRSAGVLKRYGHGRRALVKKDELDEFLGLEGACG